MPEKLDLSLNIINAIFSKHLNNPTFITLLITTVLNNIQNYKSLLKSEKKD